MEVKKTYYDNGNIKKEEQVNQEGKTHGTLKQYHENGQLSVEAEFTNGIQNDGNIVSYHENGTKARSVILKDGSFQGEYFEWHANGALSCQGIYQDDKVLERTLWDENGELLSKKDKTVNKSSENKTKIDINKDTIVTEIGGIKTNIKLGFLLDIFCELYDIDYVDQIIKEINDEEASFVDEYFVISTHFENKNNLICSFQTNEGSEKLARVLEKVFKEEFYYMRSDRYFWNVHAEVKDPFLKSFIKKTFVDSEICSSDRNEILSVTTKDHDYYDVPAITKKNFLTNDEKLLNDSLEKNDEAEKVWNAKYQYYYIRKKDFNKEKWWIGWTGVDN